jgi:short-subunit dehydrogenase
MKYAITGHTQGIGKSLFDRLTPNCIGFSKSTGYDITIKDCRRDIVKQSHDCDVFINNATAEMGQTLLLIELFNEWKDTNKVIINVGSRIAEFSTAVNHYNLLSYQAEKLILKEMSSRLQGLEKCDIRYRWFAYVGTEKILKKYPHFKYPMDYITEQEACDIILN